MKLPNRALFDYELIDYAKKLKISHFRGVFMRDDLLGMRPRIHECGIINLDSSDGPGTHWVAYSKKGNKIEYFDSFGNLKPPKELVKYLSGDCGGNKSEIIYNRDVYQTYSSTNCGKLCLKFLLSKN